VYDRRIAVDVSAYQSSREIGSFFLLAVTAAPGHPLGEVASVIDKELQAVVDEGPTESELERSMAQAEAHFVYRLQTVGGFGGKSDQLNAYNVLRRDPAYFAADLGRYRAATRQTVRAAGKTYLRFDRRVVLGVVPRGQQSLSVPGAELVSVS